MLYIKTAWLLRQVVDPRVLYKWQSRRAALRSCFGAFLTNTSYIQFILVLLLTWHRADLPGREPTYLAEPTIVVEFRFIVG